jgi:hypothetical protein
MATQSVPNSDRVFSSADVYRNLNKHCVSIRTGGRVVAHPSNVIATDVAFRVQAGGLKAMRKAGIRAVCAYARAAQVSVVEDIERITSLPGAVRVHFNPFKNDTFVLEDGRAVYGARVMGMSSPTECWLIDPEVQP